MLCLPVIAAIAGGCSSEPDSRVETGDDPAATSSEVKIGRTTQINKISYTLTGPNAFSAEGSIDVRPFGEIIASIRNVPPGSPYTLNLAASSTDGNVTCTGGKSGITVTCPGNRQQDAKFVKLTCTRNHLGREWGDRDWRSNARTFFLGAEIKLVCPQPVDAGVESGASDGGIGEVCTTCAMLGATCGIIPDGCGQVINCGNCAAGFQCLPNHQCCLNAPLTQCPAGEDCGVESDGCGGFINCGVCASGSVCNSNHCCTPTPPAMACAGKQCGAVSDGCGGTIACGTCTPGVTCIANQCEIVEHLCAAGTLSCLQGQDKLGSPTQCSQCALDNGCIDPAQFGGRCEDVPGTSASCAAVLGTSSPPSETQVCLATLDAIFKSRCAADLQEIPCLCGTADVQQCLNGTVTPNGPVFPLYACDLGGLNVPLITMNFTAPVFGAGQANVIVQCAAAFGCDCF